MSMNGMTIRGSRGGNARNQKTTFPHVVARQERAAARKLISDARTPEEQLKRLDAAGLPAQKERAKLAARIIKRDLDAQVAKMQTPEAKKAAKELFKPTFPVVTNAKDAAKVLATGSGVGIDLTKKNKTAKGQASGSSA